MDKIQLYEYMDTRNHQSSRCASERIANGQGGQVGVTAYILVNVYILIYIHMI